MHVTGLWVMVWTRTILGIGFLLALAGGVYGQARTGDPTSPSSAAGSRAAAADGSTVGALVGVVREKAKELESSAGMREGFAAFVRAHGLTPESVRYPDYVLVRLLYEATRDAGFWGTHWAVTDQPPNSDRIWKQWKVVGTSATDRTSTAGGPVAWESTATAECDELSALFAFLAERAGVRNVGLFWPYPNHTVAVWTVHPGTSRPAGTARPASETAIRVVVPTSQIFLDAADTLDTKKFDPWRQKTIYEYTRRDVPDSFELPKPLFDFFVAQLDKYGGASESTLQQLRYWREGVFVQSLTREQAAMAALGELRKRNALGAHAEDMAALEHFARDMRGGGK